MKEDDLWLKSGIQKAYHQTSIDNFQGDPDALKEIKKYILNLEDMRNEGLGIMAYGENGVGKTMLMVEILKSALTKINPRTRLPYTVYMTSLSEIVSIFTEGWSNAAKKSEFRSKVLGVDWLLIDDAEKVYMPQKENNIVLSVTDETLRKRVNGLKPVLITSNETPKELGLIFGKSVGSLLAGWVIPVKFQGSDYRKTNNAIIKWKEYFPSSKAGQNNDYKSRSV